MLRRSLILKGRASKVFLTAILLNLVVAGVYLFVFVKLQQKIEQIAELKESMSSLALKKNNLELDKKNINETSLLRAQSNNYFISKDGVVKFLNLIQSISTENKLTSTVVAVDEKPSVLYPEIFETLNIKMEVFGTWADVLHFSTLVELLPYKVLISRVSLEKLPSDGSSVSSGLKKTTVSRPWRGVLDFSVVKLK